MYFFSNLSQFEAIKHFVSTREGGVSVGEVEGLNLGYRTADSLASVQENRRILAKDLLIPLDNFCMPQQTHTANIALVTTQHKGMGVWGHETGIDATDALITQTPEICLTVLSADCALLLL